MKSFHIETWGVFLGRMAPCMGGWLIRTAKGNVGWSWGYQGAIAAIEEINNAYNQLPSCR